MRAFIEDIAYHLPDRVVTNADLQRENPTWDMDLVADKTGVLERRVAAPDETSFDLAARACETLFERHDAARIDGLISCTQTPDHLMPGNAFLLHRHLGLRPDTLAFDYNLACSGFVYGLAMASGFLATGVADRILLVTGDTYSKLVHPRDRSARALFGDGAAATIVSRGGSSRGIVDLALATSAKHYERFWVPAGGFRTPRSPETTQETTDGSGNVRSPEHIHMDGMGVWTFVNSTVPKQVQGLLGRNDVTLEQLDLAVFHQGSRLVIDSLRKALGLDEAKVFSNLARVGNTVSASIPIALKDAWLEGKLREGDTVLLSGFGVGLSAATLLMEA